MALRECITSPANESTSGKIDHCNGLLKATPKKMGAFELWVRHVSWCLPSLLTSEDMANKCLCAVITHRIETVLLLQLLETLELLYSRVLTEISINFMTCFQRWHLKYAVAKPKNFAVSIVLFGNRCLVIDVFVKKGWFKLMEKVAS